MAYNRKIFQLLFVVLITSEFSVNAYLTNVANDIHNEVRNSFRNIFRSLNRHNQPRWERVGHEHHRPQPALRPLDPTWDNPEPPYLPPEVFEPVVRDTTLMPTLPTTTTTTTPKSTTSNPSDRRRPRIPAFPNRSGVDRGAVSEFSDKAGYCPSKPTGPWICSSRCSLDTDCRGEKKCCRNRCGAMACVNPERTLPGGFDEALN